MTIIRQFRCSNCGVLYSHQISGCRSSIDDNSTQEYCHDCSTAVIDALSIIPKKYILEWVESDEVGLADVEEFENKLDTRRKNGEFVPQRVFPGLIRVQTGESQVSAAMHKNGTEYMYTYWPSQKEETLVIKKQEWVKVE